MKVLILSLVLLLQLKDDVASVWRSVDPDHHVAPGDDRPLSGAQVEAIRETLKQDKDVSGCEDLDAADSVLQKLKYQRLRLSSDNTETVLVEAGPGCLRGGQGSNGAMWIVQLKRGRVIVLASPAEEFQGYVYSVPATTNRGYRDIVVGWHMSAFEAVLVYFRFDGTRYRKLGQATARRDDDGKATIVPDK